MLVRMPKQRILVSACLLGQEVRYDGGSCAQRDPMWEAWLREGRLVPICPEMAGGLGCPRPAAEIRKGRVVNVLEKDVTEAFESGAKQALALAREHGIGMAILKEGSPSCGCHRINDGSFSGRRIDGMGITAALLVEHGIRPFSEDELATAAVYLQGLEEENDVE